MKKAFIHTTPQNIQSFFTTVKYFLFILTLTLFRIYNPQLSNPRENTSSMKIKPKEKYYFSVSSWAFSAWVLACWHSCFNLSIISFNFWLDSTKSFSDWESEASWSWISFICYQNKKYFFHFRRYANNQQLILRCWRQCKMETPTSFSFSLAFFICFFSLYSTVSPEALQ